MKNIMEYKFKSKYLNDFFYENNVVFTKVKENNNKVTYTKIKKNNKNFIEVVIDQKIGSIKEDKELRNLAFDIIDNIKKPKCIYTHIRLNFDYQSIIPISEKICIKIN